MKKLLTLLIILIIALTFTIADWSNLSGFEGDQFLGNPLAYIGYEDIQNLLNHVKYGNVQGMSNIENYGDIQNLYEYESFQVPVEIY